MAKSVCVLEFAVTPSQRCYCFRFLSGASGGSGGGGGGGGGDEYLHVLRLENSSESI